MVSRRTRQWGAFALCAAALVAGSCAEHNRPGAPPPLQAAGAAGRCATADLVIRFDFEGASPGRCTINGSRSIELLIQPEHPPPINPSPWYAFRYSAAPGAQISVTLRYSVSTHRYPPKLTRDGVTSRLPATIGDGGSSATMTLPPGDGIVSAEPLVGKAHYNALLETLVTTFAARRIKLGKSRDGRPIEAVHFGRAKAPHLLLLLGRAHPPEVSGSYAMDAFVTALAAALQRDPALAARYQVLAVPLLNPDGVARGFWRSNRGGVDLNRDWGAFSQPETRAVRDFLGRLPATVRPVLMIDFHSTTRNLFYVQGDDAPDPQRRFLAAWLGGKETSDPGYPFTIEKRDANPGRGTSKTWFHTTYDIPAYTFEVGDETGRDSAASAASDLANALLPALDAMVIPRPEQRRR